MDAADGGGQDPAGRAFDSRPPVSVIRVAVVDDHPALRAGIGAVLRTEPGMSVVGMAGSSPELAPILYRDHPDVVLLDYHLPGEDGLSVCRRVKSQVPAPGVLLYSAFTSASLAVPALVAGADGMLDKAASAHEVCEAVRAVARGRGEVVPVAPELLESAQEAVGEDDSPLLRMLVERRPPGEVMDAHGLDREAFDARVERMLAVLRVPVEPAR